MDQSITTWLEWEDVCKAPDPSISPAFLLQSRILDTDPPRIFFNAGILLVTELQPLLQLGDFRIIRQIGSGGMGIVYLAKQISLERTVALKVLGQSLDLSNAKQRFRREAQAVAKLNHPNIASVHFVGQDRNTLFMAMDYIDGLTIREVINRFCYTEKPGSSFADILRQQARTDDFYATAERFDKETEVVDVNACEKEQENPYLSPSAKETISKSIHVRRCCEIIREAACALDYAHQQGVVHRDIKPENLMVSRDGTVHIIDFGLARFCEDNTLTFTGQLVGTPLYMSPEQVVARIEVDHRTDIYSLGLVLYELLAMRPPIVASSRELLLRDIATKTIEPLNFHNQIVESPLLDIAHQAISRDPDQRYQSAGAFADDLGNYLKNKPTRARKFEPRPDLEQILGERPRSAFFLGLGTAFAAIYAFGLGLINLLPSNGLEATLFSVVGVLFSYAAWGVFQGNFYSSLLAIFLNCLAVGSSVTLITLPTSITHMAPGNFVAQFVVFFLYVPVLPICMIWAAVAGLITLPWLLKLRRVRTEFSMRVKSR